MFSPFASAVCQIWTDRFERVLMSTLFAQTFFVFLFSFLAEKALFFPSSYWLVLASKRHWENTRARSCRWVSVTKPLVWSDQTLSSAATFALTEVCFNEQFSVSFPLDTHQFLLHQKYKIKCEAACLISQPLVTVSLASVVVNIEAITMITINIKVRQEDILVELPGWTPSIETKPGGAGSAGG